MVVLSFESLVEIVKCDHSNESYREESLGVHASVSKCDHSNESYEAALSCRFQISDWHSWRDKS